MTYDDHVADLAALGDVDSIRSSWLIIWKTDFPSESMLL